ncbi:MAG TPA: DoxX family protein [bacterium]|nr:DoxX family protein [bacterium]
MDTGLLILRVVFGLLMIGHGTQKLFGWFGGPGPHKAAGFVASRGFAPAMFWTVSGSVSETVGGLFLLLGFLSPLGSIAIAAAMLTAIGGFHWPKFWAAEGGYEHALTMLTVAVAVGIAGRGAYSLDAAWGTFLPRTIWMIIAALAALGVLTSLTTAAGRRRAAAGAPQKAAA